jgi:para-nitrobenzyl esterase
MQNINMEEENRAAGLSRRKFGYGLGAAALAAGIARPGLAAPGEMSAAPIVETVYGKLRGVSLDGVAMYKGVHYGASTEGTNRFLPPKKPESWTGVRDALQLGHPSPQITQNPPVFQDPMPQSEDCLVLNVWWPSTGGSAKLPVMVWIHGGGFTNESGGSLGYDCYNLAKLGNVVAVTLNHRLNIFGYLYLGDKDERFATSGNVGQLDLIAALQWVRDNIANFGGDPSNVTIFGESGGGAKVSTLIGMPAAEGLFHKAIVQSGSILEAMKPTDAAHVTQEIFTLLGLKQGDIAALQQVPADKLLEAYGKLQPKEGAPTFTFAPVLDGRAVPRHPWDPAAPSYAAKIPMIIGTTSDELGSLMSRADLLNPMSDDSAIADMIGERAIFGTATKEQLKSLIAHYRRVYPDFDNTELLVRVATDVGFWRLSAIQEDRKVAAGGPPLFVYEFAWKTPWAGGAFAIHGVELPFVFGHKDFPTWGEDDSPEIRAADDPKGDRYGLIRKTLGAWAAFAHTGNPSTSSLRWPQYDLKTRPTMIFDHETRVENDPKSAVRKEVLAL